MTMQQTNTEQKFQPAQLNQIQEPLKILSMNISNVMGLEEYELSLDGDLTVIEGRNGHGKTSLVSSLLAMLGGGYPAEMIRSGTDKAEIVGVFSNGLEARKRISTSKNKCNLTVKRDGITQQAPQSIINSLVDEYSVNPLKFIQAKPEDQVSLLLKAIPMQIEQNDLNALSGLTDIAADGHALVALEHAYKALFKMRTDINSQTKKAAASVERLKQSLPDNYQPAQELKKQAATLEALLKTEQEKTNRAISAIDEKKQAGYQRVINDKSSQTQKLHDNEIALNKQLEQLQAQLRDVKQAQSKVAEETELKRSQLDQWAESKKAGLREKHTSDMTDTKSRLAAIQAQLESVATYENTRKILDDETADFQALVTQQKSLNERMTAIKHRKSELAANIPVPGLAIGDGCLLFNDVPFNMVNTAEKMRLAVSVAALRLPTGPDALRLVVIDGAESMDRDTVAALTAATREAGIQLLLVRTTDSPLTVTHGLPGHGQS